MALVSFIPPIKVEIPHEPGEWMEFRKPASRVVREARKVVETEGRQGVRDFGAEIVKAMNSGDDADKAVIRAQKLATLQEYEVTAFDRATLLRSAITAWSYVDPVAHQTIKVTAENIEDLDEETARWAVQYVVNLMKPLSKEADKSLLETSPSGA